MILMDNAPCHKRVQSPHENHQVKFIPPYSPFLNIVEECFSVLKSNIKNHIANLGPAAYDKEAARLRNLNMLQYRMSLLEEAAEDSWRCITAAKCAAFQRHMQSFLPRCINKEIIW